MIPAIPCSFAVLVARRDERDERDERTIAGTDSLYQYLEQAGRGVWHILGVWPIRPLTSNASFRDIRGQAP